MGFNAKSLELIGVALFGQRRSLGVNIGDDGEKLKDSTVPQDMGLSGDWKRSYTRKTKGGESLTVKPRLFSRQGQLLPANPRRFSPYFVGCELRDSPVHRESNPTSTILSIRPIDSFIQPVNTCRSGCDMGLKR
ncbi:MAG: hypothetical protein N2C14_09670, partial [Planctomycetales bacterium]